ncbi:MAG: hypothetical protein IPM29_13570 [Planctomycetes bacterium]|nr:hypothetical protein [Planctomycetota bacterium]
MPRLEDLLRLGRPVDWGYPTNRAIVIVVGIVAVVLFAARLAAGDGPGAAGLLGLRIALATFLAWALAREIDPDGERAAFLGAGFAAAWTGAMVESNAAPNVAALFWLLLVLRIANRSPGRSAGWLDTATVLGLTAYGAALGEVQVAFLAALAFAVDGLARDPLKRHLAAAGLAVVGGLVAAMLRTGSARTALGDDATLPAVLSGLTLVAALRFTYGRPPESVGDRDGRRLDARRVGAARALLVLAGWSFALRAGNVGVAALAPAWAALAGVALWPLRR